MNNYTNLLADLVNVDIEIEEEQIVFSKSDSTKTLTVRGRSSSEKDNCDHGTSRSRPGFKYLKKNQCAFCKELGHEKVDCPRIKYKNKELETDANIVRMINTQMGSTSLEGESNTDSSVFFFSVTTIIGYSGDSE